MPAQNMPAAEVEIDDALVRALLSDQHPDLADLPLVAAAHGFDNVIYRLGDELCVRLPRRQIAVQLIENEHRWLPELAPQLPLPVPTPLRTGRPSADYPWPWSVCRWLGGEMASRRPPANLEVAAEVLGGFVRALHQPAPADAPANPFRGGHLETRAIHMEERASSLHDMLDADRVLSLWRFSLAAPVWEGPPLWLHGDLHVGNILVDQGEVSAVIDFGDLTAGDPATDLALAWMLFPPDARRRFRAAAGGCDDATWERARGWALFYAVAYLASSADSEGLARVGRSLLDAVLADAS